MLCVSACANSIWKRTRDLAYMEKVQCSLLMTRVLKNHAPMLFLLTLECQWLSSVEILGSLGLEDEVCCAQVAFGFAEMLSA